MSNHISIYRSSAIFIHGLALYLEENGIASDVVHVRNDQYSCFKDFKDDTLEGLRSFESRLLHIPVGFWVTDEDREHIVKVVNSYE